MVQMVYLDFAEHMKWTIFYQVEEILNPELSDSIL